jgi:protein pelota
LRILFQNSRTGEIRVQLENQDDVWHIYNIIEKGDLVTAATYRRVETKLFKEKLRPERGEKRKMTLGVRVEEAEHHEFTDRLRVSGKIEAGPQDLGQHHTLNLELGDIVTIKKDKWTVQQLVRVKEAVAAAKRPLITFLSIDDSEAVFAVLRQAGLQPLSNIVSHVPGKGYESEQSEKKKEYYGEVLAELRRVFTEGALIVLGPGFAKEEFCAFAKDKDGALMKKCEVRATGQSGLTGIHELLKSGIDVKLLEGQRAAYEIQMVEKLLEEIAKDGKFAYGTDDIRLAVESGAVECLLILDRLLRDRKNEELLRLAESASSRILVVSSSHEGGRKLDSLGGMAAILRYKM